MLIKRMPLRDVQKHSSGFFFFNFFLQRAIQFFLAFKSRCREDEKKWVEKFHLTLIFKTYLNLTVML